MKLIRAAVPEPKPEPTPPPEPKVDPAPVVEAVQAGHQAVVSAVSAIAADNARVLSAMEQAFAKANASRPAVGWHLRVERDDDQRITDVYAEPYPLKAH